MSIPPEDLLLLVWNCPYCGRFTSPRTISDHEECFQAIHLAEIAEERAWVEGWR